VFDQNVKVTISAALWM